MRMDTMEDNLELLGLLALLLLLIPLCVIFFVCCVYSGHTQLWRRWFFSHSNRTSSRGCPRTLAPRCVPRRSARQDGALSGRQPEQPLGDGRAVPGARQR